MEKEAQLEHEDPDKLYAEEAEDDEGGNPKKPGRGRGKGRGKGRGARGRGRGGRGKKDSETEDKNAKRNDKAGQSSEPGEEQGPGKKQKVSEEQPVTTPPLKRKKVDESAGKVSKSAKLPEKAPDVCVVEDWQVYV